MFIEKTEPGVRLSSITVGADIVATGVDAAADTGLTPTKLPVSTNKAKTAAKMNFLKHFSSFFRIIQMSHNRKILLTLV
jgi:hypothetical protein